MPRGLALLRAILLAPFAAILGVLVGVHLFIPVGIIEWLLGITGEPFILPAQFIGAGLGAIAAIVITFRRAARVDGRGTIFGTARWANRKERRALTEPKDGLLVGRAMDRSKALMRYDGVAHLLTLAPTRSGKGVGTIIPNLLTADRSVICIDPKGENARVAGRGADRERAPNHVKRTNPERGL